MLNLLIVLGVLFALEAVECKQSFMLFDAFQRVQTREYDLPGPHFHQIQFCFITERWVVRALILNCF
jgi:hypothetical protein